MVELLSQFQELPTISLAAFAMVAAAGVLMGLAPSSLPLISVVVGSVAARGTSNASGAGRQGLLFASGFVLGIATIDALLGGLFGFLGTGLVRLLADSLVITNLVLATILAAMGLALLRKIHIPWLRVHARPREVSSFGGAYALGIPFGLSTCPACTPMVLPVLGAAAATGEAWVGAALLFTFGIARGVPLMIAGAATGTVKRLTRPGTWVLRIERACGVLLLLVAVYFVYESAAATGIVPPLEYLLAKTFGKG